MPARLSRADLSWRALLHATPTLALPDRDSVPAPRSALLEGQGIAVFRRRAGNLYAALDYGHPGGGHGHPDRLNLLLATETTRWLDDYGTGSYVDPSLHWYRSTLAHNAPLVNGRSQIPVHGALLAYEEGEHVGWVMASAEEFAPGTSAARTLVVMEDYLVDALEWRADQRVTVDLPVHVDVRIERGATERQAGELTGGKAPDDGFQYVRDATYQRADAGATLELAKEGPSGRPLRVWWCSGVATEWWRAMAPGPPGTGERPFRLVRAVGEAGLHRSVWSWSDAVKHVAFGEGITVVQADGSVHEHRRTPNGWRLDVRSDGGTRTIELGGMTDVDEAEAIESLAPIGMNGDAQELHVGTVFELEMAEAHYRRSEESWLDAGAPTATASVEWTGTALLFGVRVSRSDRTFVPAEAINAYDNESPDINGDSVQLYVATDRGRSGWILVPEADSDAVRIRQFGDWSAPQSIEAVWEPTASGYAMRIELPIEPPDLGRGPTPVSLDLIVNEMPQGRMRRRGQLVLSGGAGAFVYLRGDRHDPSRLIPFLLAHD